MLTKMMRSTAGKASDVISILFSIIFRSFFPDAFSFILFYFLFTGLRPPACSAVNKKCFRGVSKQSIKKVRGLSNSGEGSFTLLKSTIAHELTQSSLSNDKTSMSFEAVKMQEKTTRVKCLEKFEVFVNFIFLQ